jgi:hypothetical protein
MATTTGAPALSGLALEAAQALIKSAEAFHKLTETGGYAGVYKSDGRQYGESSSQTLDEDEIWVQPPGTPAITDSLIKTYELTKDLKVLGYAVEAGQALANAQLASGGWNYVGDGDGTPRSANSPYTTYDDMVTPGALDALMHLDKYVDATWLTSAIKAGLNFVVSSQTASGGWQQTYGSGAPDYRYLLTFNDGAMNGTIDTMFRAYAQYGERTYLVSALEGADFILKTQITSNGQAGWAAQYDANLKPAAARSYEPPALDSSVTADNIRTLLETYLITGNSKYLAPIKPALDWLDEVKLGDDKYSRFYELGTDRPIYGKRDGTIVYDYSKFPSSDKDHYAWQDDFNVAEAKADYELVMSLGRDGYLAKHPLFVNTTLDDPLYDSETSMRTESSLQKSAAGILDDLSSDGYWKSGSDITAKEFYENTTLLQDYLKKVTGVVAGPVPDPTPGDGDTPDPDPTDPTTPPPGPIALKITNSADTLTGSTHGETISGLGGNDKIHGLAGADKLLGDAGNDRIYGGLGSDTLTGGTGKDRFHFDSVPNSTSNMDRITDYAPGEDTMRLDHAIYTELGKTGTLKATGFFTGTAAHDADDRIIYNKATGAIFYDADGTGATAAVQFAQVDPHLVLTQRDFVVY